MSRRLCLLAAIVLHSCPRSGERMTGADASTSSADASTSSAVTSSGEAAPLAERSPAEAETDAGVREGPGTMIACGRNAHLNCRFQGRVRSLRATVLEPGERPTRQSRFRERATEVILDDVSGLACANMEIAGIQLGYEGSDVRKRRDGPSPTFEPIFHGEIPVIREIMITLDPRYRLPFAEGDVICGSVIAFWISDLVEREWLIARPNGDVLLAHGGMMPRDPSPVPGWTFKLGPRVKFERPEEYHDMWIRHGGISVRIPFIGEPARLRAPDGEFEIDAAGYVTVGYLGVLEKYLAKQGYGFSIVRVGEGTQPAH